MLRFKVDIDKLYTNATKEEFNSHFKSIIKMEFNPGNPNIFFTFGEDNFLKVFDYEQNMPLQILEISSTEELVDAVWLKSNPNCILTVS